MGVGETHIIPSISILSSAYNSVNFLITWNADLNQQDTDTGVTALHLATM